jgi:aryl-alcohol dehydrogenase-like predicted oxidoreductase
VIGFGAWEIGEEASVTAQERAIGAIRAGIDAGMTWIDTAEIYGMGRSEELVARAVQDRPDVLVFTKIWHELHGGLTLDEVRRGAEASVKRLGRVIDLYLILEPDPTIRVEETWEAMTRVVEDGLVRFIGVSNLSADLLKRCEGVQHVDAVENQCSLLYRNEYEALRANCEQQGTAFIAYGPLALGLLTGKIGSRTSFTATSWGRGKIVDELSSYQRPLFGPDVLPGHLRYVERARRVADRIGVPMAQLALAWVVCRDEFAVAIAGSTSPENTVQNALAGDIELSEADLQELTDLSDTRE